MFVSFRGDGAPRLQPGMRVGPLGHPRELRLPLDGPHAALRRSRRPLSDKLKAPFGGEEQPAAVGGRETSLGLTSADQKPGYDPAEVTPLARLGEPEDTAAAVAFLCHLAG